MSQTLTAPAARRTCRWLIGPDRGPDGLSGCVTLTVNGQRSHYRLREVRSDDMGRVVELSKELRDGSFAPPYRVTLPAWGRGRCSLPGAPTRRGVPAR